MQVVGLNYFIFVCQILYKGKEWLLEVIVEINVGWDLLVLCNILLFCWLLYLLQGLGMIFCVYLCYYYMKDDLLCQELVEVGGEGICGEVVKQLEKILFDQYCDLYLVVKLKVLEGCGGQYYFEVVCELMNVIYNDKWIIMYVNMCNNGVINGLLDDCVVEVSLLIIVFGLLFFNVVLFLEDILCLLQLMKLFEWLIIEVVFIGNCYIVWCVLMLNLLIVSGEKFELVLDEVIVENCQWLFVFYV